MALAMDGGLGAAWVLLAVIEMAIWLVLWRAGFRIGDIPEMIVAALRRVWAGLRQTDDR